MVEARYVKDSKFPEIPIKEFRARINAAIDWLIGNDAARKTAVVFDRPAIRERVTDGLLTHLSHELSAALKLPYIAPELPSIKSGGGGASHPVIGLHGAPGVGKDAITAFAMQHSWRRQAFADPVRQVCSMIFSIPLNHFIDRDKKEDVDPYIGVSPRHLLRIVGTEVFRNADPQIWLKRAQLDIESATLPTIITDVRFEDEADFIRQSGHLVHVYRDNNPFSHVLSSHASDSGVSHKEYDYEIHNNGTLEKLEDDTLELLDYLIPPDGNELVTWKFATQASVRSIGVEEIIAPANEDPGFLQELIEAKYPGHLALFVEKCRIRHLAGHAEKEILHDKKVKVRP